MSIEAYEQLVGRFELYGKLQEGLNDARQGNTRLLSEAIAEGKTAALAPHGTKKTLTMNGEGQKLWWSVLDSNQ